MLNLPSALRTEFETCLGNAAIPKPAHAAYTKWLRYDVGERPQHCWLEAIIQATTQKTQESEFHPCVGRGRSYDHDLIVEEMIVYEAPLVTQTPVVGWLPCSSSPATRGCGDKRTVSHNSFAEVWYYDESGGLVFLTAVQPAIF